jgi:hypothetical protein
MGEPPKRGRMSAADPDKNISIALTDKAHALVEAEAKARGMTIGALALAALFDFLGRSAKISAVRQQPLVVHFDQATREAIVAGAQERRQSVNAYVRFTVERRLQADMRRRQSNDQKKAPCELASHGAGLSPESSSPKDQPACPDLM